MSGIEFHNTVYGRRFFDAQLPKLIGALERIATAMEQPRAAPGQTPIAAPLTGEQIKARAKDGRIREVVAIGLDALVTGDLERLNDAVSEAITAHPGGLADLSYSVVGVVTEKNDGILAGSVLIEVDAEIDRDMLDE